MILSQEKFKQLEADNAALRQRLARLVEAAESIADYSTPFEGYLDGDDLKELKQAIADVKEVIST